MADCGAKECLQKKRGRTRFRWGSLSIHDRCANRFASLDQKHDFDDESKPGGNKLEFVNGKVFFGEPKQLLCSPTDVEDPHQNNSSDVVFGNVSAILGEEGTCFDAEEDPPLDREQHYDDE
eukprot:2322619-Amphidinium_carterae.1